MASNALATAPKSIQAQAQSLARAAANKKGKEVRGKQKLASTGLGALSSGLLGIAERLAGPSVQLGPIDNGLTIGAPIAILGACMSSKWGDYIMMFGNGPLFAGIRQTAKTAGVKAEGDDTSGQYDSVP